MKIKKKFIMFAISFAVMISLFPTVNAKAANSNLNIISESQVTAAQAKNWAKSKGATDTFIGLADLYFKYYSEHGNVNPAIAYVQAAKETGYGKFGGVLDESFHNPCGLKIKTAGAGSDTNKNEHKKFDNWDQGVQAHLDHLALYAGAQGYPRDNTYDERHFVSIKGTAPTVDSLDGKWAPSQTYGEEISTLYNDLLSYSGIKVSNNANVKNNNTINNDSSVPDPTVSKTKSDAGNSKSNVTSTTAGWKSENKTWYYFNAPGVMCKGWIKPNDVWYYMQDDGSMATGWINLKGAWYYLNDTGAMVIGWTEYNGYWYYLDPVSGAMTKKSKVAHSNKIITIDPGHDYGKDGGAVSTINGVTYNEVDLNIQVAAKLKVELEKRGYTVIMTREDGEKPNYGSMGASLKHKADTANNVNADLFICIHHNSVDGIPTAKGVETYYSEHPKDAEYGGGLDSAKVEKSKQIAKAINDKVANAIGANNRGVKNDYSADVGSLFVLRNTKMPGILIEVGFITNPEEAVRCADPDSQQKVAEAIADAIAENLN